MSEKPPGDKSELEEIKSRRGARFGKKLAGEKQSANSVAGATEWPNDLTHELGPDSLTSFAPAATPKEPVVGADAVEPSQEELAKKIREKEGRLAEVENKLKEAELDKLKREKARLLVEKKKLQGGAVGRLTGKMKGALTKSAEEEQARNVYTPGAEFDFSGGQKIKTGEKKKTELEQLADDISKTREKVADFHEQQLKKGPQEDTPKKVESENPLFEQAREAQMKVDESRKKYALGFKEKESRFKKLLSILPIKKFRGADEVPEVQELHSTYLADFQNYSKLREQLAAEEYKSKGKMAGDAEMKALLYELKGGEAIRLIKAKDEAGRQLREARANEGKETGWDHIAKYTDKWSDWWNKKVPPKAKLAISSAIIGVGFATGVGLPVEFAALWRFLGGTAAAKAWYEKGMLKFEDKQDKRIKKEVGKIMKEADASERLGSFVSKEEGAERKAKLLASRLEQLRSDERIREVEQKMSGKQKNLAFRSIALGGVIASGKLGIVLKETFGFTTDLVGLGGTRDAVGQYVGGKIHEVRNLFGSGGSSGTMRQMAESAVVGAEAEMPKEIKLPSAASPEEIPQSPGGKMQVPPEAAQPQEVPIEQTEAPKIKEIGYGKVVEGGGIEKTAKEIIKANPGEFGLNPDDPRLNGKAGKLAHRLARGLAEKNGMSYEDLDKLARNGVQAGDEIRVYKDAATGKFNLTYNGPAFDEALALDNTSAAEVPAAGSSSAEVVQSAPTGTETATPEGSPAAPEPQTPRSAAPAPERQSVPQPETPPTESSSGETEQQKPGLRERQLYQNEINRAEAVYRQGVATRGLIEHNLLQKAGITENIWDKPYNSVLDKIQKGDLIAQDVRDAMDINKLNEGNAAMRKLLNILPNPGLGSDKKVWDIFLEALNNDSRILEKVNGLFN